MARKKREIKNVELLETEVIGTEDLEVVEDTQVVKMEKEPFEIIKFNVNDIASSEIVKKTQLALKELGYNLNILGNYDTTTYGAVCDYKRKKGYKEVNGDINEKLYKELIVNKVGE